jgi:hypothetical protein
MKPSILLIQFLFSALLFYPCREANVAEVSSNTSARGLCKEIESIIQVPVFKDARFNVDYKAQQGTDSEAFEKAIEACNQSGGGMVVAPEGIYHTGPIHLLDNVQLHVRIEKAEEAFSIEHVKNLRFIDTYANGSLLQSPVSSK